MCGGRSFLIRFLVDDSPHNTVPIAIMDSPFLHSIEVHDPHNKLDHSGEYYAQKVCERASELTNRQVEELLLNANMARYWQVSSH